VDAQRRATITPYRLRHTVGAQLAQRGAKLHTIMKILGHNSVSMALLYAQISDPEVLREYQSVPGPGSALAGPAAEALRSGTFASAALEWMKRLFSKPNLRRATAFVFRRKAPVKGEIQFRRLHCDTVDIAKP
jgi:Phage integrase family